MEILRRVLRLSGVVLFVTVLAAACGGGSNDATAVADPRCLMVKAQDPAGTMKQLCCKQADEVAQSPTVCANHVAIGCAGKLYCTFYTDDDQVTHACMSAASCNDCERAGDTGLDLWCHDHLLYGD
jgi:hypothetical protein